MRKRILLLAVCALFVITASFANAQGSTEPSSVGQGAQGVTIAPPPGDTTIDSGVRQILPVPPIQTEPNSLFGQEHHYSVTFRGNGEAIVLVKTLFSNQKEETLNTLRFTFPRTVPQDITVYQVLKDPICIRYRPDYTYDQPTATVPDPNCLEYKEPDYNDFLYGDARFQKVPVEFTGDTLTATLPIQVAPQKAGALLIYYRVTGGYTKRDFYGAYDYVFETIKIEEPITTLTVGISADADQILKGSKGVIEYGPTSEMAALKMSDAAVAGAPLLNRYYGMIGQGQIIKQATNLQAAESYTVKGSFADSYVKLYAKEVTTGIFVLAIVIVVLLAIMRLVFFKPARGTKTEPTRNNFGLASFVVIGSFVISILVIIFTVGLVYLINNVGLYAAGGGTYSILVLFVAVVAVFFYALLVLVPAVIIGVRRGVWWGLGLFGATVLWLAMYLVVVIFFLILTKPQFSPPIIPLRGGGVMMDGAAEAK